MGISFTLLRHLFQSSSFFFFVSFVFNCLDIPTVGIPVCSLSNKIPRFSNRETLRSTSKFENKMESTHFSRNCCSVVYYFFYFLRFLCHHSCCFGLTYFSHRVKGKLGSSPKFRKAVMIWNYLMNHWKELIKKAEKWQIQFLSVFVEKNDHGVVCWDEIKDNISSAILDLDFVDHLQCSFCA